MIEAVASLIFCVVLAAVVLALVLGAAWWAFRMVFWIIIIFIGEAGAAWRGQR
jgi:hypothetical protein